MFSHVFHEMTKHMDVDCYFIREKLEFGDINPTFVNFKKQLIDIFTKFLR